MPTPEEEARKEIDEMLTQCGWMVQDRKELNLSAARGIAVREARMRHGYADYLLCVDGKAIGTVEAKPADWTLTGVESQSESYSRGVPPGIPSWRHPLPFSYESTGAKSKGDETSSSPRVLIRFTNRLEPDFRSRDVFAFHRPETLAELARGKFNLRECVRHLPTLVKKPPIGKPLWDAQYTAIRNLEGSLARNDPRGVIQMGPGSGKTFAAVSVTYRLIKFGNAKRVLFLVDRAHLGRQALKEFQQYESPYTGLKFADEYNVQLLKSNSIDPASRVCITTIQRLYSTLKGEESLPEETDEAPLEQLASIIKKPVPVEYNAKIPIEAFDFVIIDECHRSIYNLWRQVVEYFDAFLTGLTATPSRETLAFFNQNLVMEYSHAQGVADNINVDYEVYRIRTQITEQGAVIEAGFYIEKRDRLTRRRRWEQLDEALEYGPEQLDRDVVSEDQIRTIMKTFRQKLPTEIFPGRTEVPKTLIYAKDDSHADDIVKIVREVFNKGNDFCQKITYKTTGNTEDLIALFRNSYGPRIAVTVDLIATGTDVKPLEIVFFMRSVRSRIFFEQMKGRGARVVPSTEFQAVTPDADNKDRFVIVDAVGVCERDKTDSYPLDRTPTVSFEKLLEAIAFGNRNVDTLSSVAARLARLSRHLSDDQLEELQSLAGGQSLHDVVSAIIEAIDPDRIEDKAKEIFNASEPTADQLIEATLELANVAVEPIATNPEFRNRLIELKQSREQIIDKISPDRVIKAGFDLEALSAARSEIQSFSQFIDDNKDKIVALQIILGRSHGRLRFEDVKQLAEAITNPPRSLTTSKLWHAYEVLDRSKVQSTTRSRLLADIVSLVRFAIGKDTMLRPYVETVTERFQNWLTAQESLGRKFTPEQQAWLEIIRDHISTSLSIASEDFDLTPFVQRGGISRAYQLFGQDLGKVLEELNEALVP